MSSRRTRSRILTARASPRLRLAVWLEANSDLGDERLRRPDRCRAMLAARSGQGQKPFQREPVPVCVRGLRDAFRRVGNIARAALYEQELAEIETHAKEAWAVDAPAGGSTP